MRILHVSDLHLGRRVGDLDASAIPAGLDDVALGHLAGVGADGDHPRR